MTNMPKCRICSKESLQEIQGFGTLSRVTSDCKTFPSGGRLAVCLNCGAIQKPIDTKWEMEADEIYSQYTPYHSSDGAEQAVFDVKTGAPRSRSDVILEHLHNLTPVSDTGTVLDVGCGNGALLSAFSDFRPGWTLDGQDLSEINLPSLKSIAGFRNLHTVALPEVGKQYDIVTLMHSLEHFPDPAQGLKDLRHVLADDAVLLVQVPNIEATPFDLLIADHVSHFTKRDLAALFAAAGFSTLAIADDWISKELSVVAGPSVPGAQSEIRATSPNEVLTRVSAQIDWLGRVVEQANNAAAQKKPFGIFGTSIAATWLFGQLGEQVDFFVDEDPNCEGRTLFDRPIYRPSTAPLDSNIYVALTPQIADLVVQRLRDHHQGLIAPPKLEQ